MVSCTLTKELVIVTNNNTMEETETVNQECSFKKGDKEPCSNCPRKITALYMCKLLQEISEESE